jgi:hypothetical protein
MQNGYVSIDLNLQLFGQASSTSRQGVAVYSLVAGALKFRFVNLGSLCKVSLKPQK